MRMIGMFLVSCAVIAALRFVVIAFALVAIVMLLWTLCFRPVQLLCFLTMCAVLKLLETHPMLVAGLVTAVIIAGRISRLDSPKMRS